MFCMQNRVLPVERASFPTCMPIFTARIADPRPGRAPDPSRLFYEAEASTLSGQASTLCGPTTRVECGSEDKEIASLLTEALALREEMELYAQV